MLGCLFIVFSSLLPFSWQNIFPWHETDPIGIILVWYLVFVFLIIGVILKEIRTKLPILKINTMLPFYTIGYLAVNLFTAQKFMDYCIISSWVVIIISFISIIITTLISLRKIALALDEESPQS